MLLKSSSTSFTTIHKILNLHGGNTVFDSIQESIQENIQHSTDAHNIALHGFLLKYMHTFFELSATIISMTGDILLLVGAFIAIINTIHLAYLKTSGKKSNLLLGNL